MSGKIVSIHSFRGGTGKSNTTANLAAQVALAGKRVGVVDTDIQSPGIHVLFGLDEDKMGKTMNDFLHGTATIREIGFNIGDNTGDAEGRSKLKGKNLWLFPSSIRGREISQILREGVDFNLLKACGLHPQYKFYICLVWEKNLFCRANHECHLRHCLKRNQFQLNP